jgi:hypothetical protein
MQHLNLFARRLPYMMPEHKLPSETHRVSSYLDLVESAQIIGYIVNVIII